MIRILKKINCTRWLIIVAALLFVFSASASWSETEENITEENSNEGELLAADVGEPDPLQERIEAALISGASVEALIAELIDTGVSAPDIICALFTAGVEHQRVIASALDYGLANADVAVWAEECGATVAEVQVGYSMAGESFIFNAADDLNKTADEYRYNPPSPSQ